MKTREKGFAYYGIPLKLEKKIKSYCRRIDFDDWDLLMRAAVEAKREIADDLYYSLRCGVSYDELTKIKYIPIGKGDFYAYRRKCMKIFRDLMILNRLWE